MNKEKTTNNNSNHNNTIIGKWDMYIHDVGPPATVF